MTQKCFDEGTIQAFLDGELASDLSEKVACHIALCNECAAILDLAEEENSFAFAALDSELNPLVPTERIRTRLFETIAAERKSFWQRIFGKGLGWSPHITAFTAIAVVFMTIAVFYGVKNPSANNDNLTAKNDLPEMKKVLPEAAKNIENKSLAPTEKTADGELKVVRPMVEKVSYQPRNDVRVRVERAVYEMNESSKIIPKIAIRKPKSEYAMDDEQTYLRTIETLKQTVDERKDEILRPALRVSYERDLAIANDAIDKMRKEVRKNPKNAAAKDVLRASYQNKIDLLNSVAEKGELMASIK